MKNITYLIGILAGCCFANDSVNQPVSNHQMLHNIADALVNKSFVKYYNDEDRTICLWIPALNDNYPFIIYPDSTEYIKGGQQNQEKDAVTIEMDVANYLSGKTLHWKIHSQSILARDFAYDKETGNIKFSWCVEDAQKVDVPVSGVLEFNSPLIRIQFQRQQFWLYNFMKSCSDLSVLFNKDNFLNYKSMAEQNTL